MIRAAHAHAAFPGTLELLPAGDEPKPGSAATFLFRTATFVARPDSVDACRSEIDALVRHVHCHEPRTAFIGSFQKAADPCSFLLVLVFEDSAAERTHHGSPARLRFDRRLAELAAGGARLEAWQPGAGL